jgi:hypothetical protein
MMQSVVLLLGYTHKDVIRKLDWHLSCRREMIISVLHLHFASYYYYYPGT